MPARLMRFGDVTIVQITVLLVGKEDVPGNLHYKDLPASALFLSTPLLLPPTPVIRSPANDSDTANE